MSNLSLFIDAAFVDNLALTFFLGMCTFLATSKRVETAWGVALAVVVVLLVTVPVNALVYIYVLKPGAWSWAGMPELDLSHLVLISFIGVIAATVQVLEMVLKRHFKELATAMGIFLPLVTVNCAILGASLFMVERDLDLGQSVVFAAGSGFGWGLAVLALAAIRERLSASDVPAGLRGLGIAFVITGILSMAFLVLSGLVAGGET